jgi:AcrR family transcriptional regulator
MPRTKKQFEDIRENRKEMIIHTALHLFAEEGYHNTPISKIAKTAGISKGLLYNYFESKEELLRALFYKISEQVVGNIKNVDLNSIDIKFFKTWLNNFFKQIENDIVHWKLYMNLINQPAIAKIFEKEAEMIHKNVFDSLSMLFAKKKIKKPYAHAILFHAMMDGVIVNYMNDLKNFPIEDVKELIIEKFFGQLT